MRERGETQFTRCGDVDIAYQVVGSGDRDLLFLPGWVSNLEVMWEPAELAGFLERLARLGRLIVFDKRGTGLSDGVAGTPTLEGRAADVGALLDACEVEHRGASVIGLAVHVAARVAALARASEVLVTSAVQMLVPGSGIRFADRGTHVLKGVAEPWQLFAVEHA